MMLNHLGMTFCFSVADPNQKFWIWFRSRSGLKLVLEPDQIPIESDINLDSNPELNPRNQDPNPGSRYRSTTGQNFFFSTKTLTQPHL
jgi:hypothetical protein